MTQTPSTIWQKLYEYISFRVKTEKGVISTSEASFLDLFNVAENKQFKILLYDKREAVPFIIINIIMHL